MKKSSSMLRSKRERSLEDPAHASKILNKKEGVAGVHSIIDWLLRKFDIPHKKYGVWMNGIEYSSVPGINIKPPYKKRV